MTPSPGFLDWLARHEVSLAFSSYSSSRLFFLGLGPDGELASHSTFFDRCTGLCLDGTQTLWLGDRTRLWRLENIVPANRSRDGFDRVFAPQLAFTTGDLRIHDVALDAAGRPVFANTLYSCLARADDRTNFCFLWKPPFIHGLAPDDRCHLNGLATVDGAPRYVTVCGQTDATEGWRDQALRRTGGAVLDVPSGEVALGGLSAPHSPRWHDGHLYVLHSGVGEFGRVDLARGRFEPICFCPGFLRGLAFHDHFALLGLSACREHRSFDDLALGEKLSRLGREAACALAVVDLRSGEVVHTLDLGDAVSEIYDVLALPGVRRPAALTLDEFTASGLTISSAPLR